MGIPTMLSSRMRGVKYASVAMYAVTSHQGLTLVPVSAQLELTLPLSAQLKLTLSPIQPKLTRGCGPTVLKLSSNGSDVIPKVSS